MTADDPLIGRKLGEYKVVRQLGHGGMGTVYEGYDTKLKREVALKVLRAQYAHDPAYRERFEQEVLVAPIAHPHIVPVYTANYRPPTFYIAMQKVDGKDLGKVLRAERPLDERRALRIIGQVASALQAVHERKVVHRDVKPQNILLWHAGQRDEHVLLTDFGIAVAADARHDTGSGTPGYMAPELRRGEPPTPAVDEYALGCVAYELLSGLRPWDDDVTSRPDAHLYGRAVPLSVVAPGVTAHVADAVDRALEEDPAARYADIGAFVEAIEHAASAFRSSQHEAKIVLESPDTEEAERLLSGQPDMTAARISQIVDSTRTVSERRNAARSRLFRPSSRRDR